jgi:hypothetical protein
VGLGFLFSPFLLSFSLGDQDRPGEALLKRKRELRLVLISISTREKGNHKRRRKRKKKEGNERK